VSIGWALRGVLIAALTPVGLAACGGSGASTGSASTAESTPAPAAQTEQPTPTTAQPAAVKGPAIVKVGRSRLGSILVDASGHTLYLFTQDKPKRSLCTADYLNCATIWVPLMTTGSPRGEAGVKTRLLGVLHRTKPAGSQVTYNGRPLYLFVDDKQPGDLKGQAMYDYWYVLSPSGRPVKKK
jgi:predicted lipoprotein with Yx(FWY)xxD motif